MKTIRLTKKSIGIITIIIILGVIVSIKVLPNIMQEKAWKKAKMINSTTSYQSYTKKYPEGKYADSAYHFWEELEWIKTKKTYEKELYENFLNTFPEGKYSEQADLMVEKLTKPDWLLLTNTTFKYFSDFKILKGPFSKNDYWIITAFYRNYGTNFITEYKEEFKVYYDNNKWNYKSIKVLKSDRYRFSQY